jgi:hypothetical protein
LRNGIDDLRRLAVPAGNGCLEQVQFGQRAALLVDVDEVGGLVGNRG